MSVAPPTVPLAPETLTPETIIARLQHDLVPEAQQQAIAPARLEATLAQTVHELWDQSRVKTFVPLFAVRETRARLALRGAGGDASMPGQASAAPASPATVVDPSDDGFALADDDVLELDDDVLDLD